MRSIVGLRNSFRFLQVACLEAHFLHATVRHDSKASVTRARSDYVNRADRAGQHRRTTTTCSRSARQSLCLLHFARAALHRAGSFGQSGRASCERWRSELPSDLRVPEDVSSNAAFARCGVLTCRLRSSPSCGSVCQLRSPKPRRAPARPLRCRTEARHVCCAMCRPQQRPHRWCSWDQSASLPSLTCAACRGLRERDLGEALGASWPCGPRYICAVPSFGVEVA